jgi:hypothetical protein
MARKRIIYQSEALYTGPTGEANPLQLHRIQDVSHSVEVTRTDVNTFGRLAALSREVIEAPTVSCDFSYYVVDGYNESGLGFETASLGTPALSGIMQSSGTAAEKNYYIMTSKEGVDAIGSSSANNGVIGIGNGYITSYGLEASVGEIPTASVSAEGINVRFDTDASNFASPAINPADGSAVSNTTTLAQASTGSLSAFALRPGDISIDFGTASLQGGGVVLPGMTAASSTGVSCVQSASLDVPLGRTPLQCLGDTFPTSRELDFPINVTLAVNANVSDIQSGTLRDLICNDAQKRNITLTMNNKCGGGTSVVYQLKGAQLDSQNMSSSIGDNKTVDLSFSAQIGGATDTGNGLFISGTA